MAILSESGIRGAILASLPRDIVEAYERDPESVWYIDTVINAFAANRQALEVGLDGAYFLTATRGAYATGTVTARVTTIVDLTLRSGAEFQAEDGRRYYTTHDAQFPLGTTSVALSIQAAYQGTTHNLVDANEIASFVGGTWIADDLGSEITGPPVTLVSSTAVTGGTFPMLELLGHGRGVRARKDEGTDALRERAFSRPLKVTPTNLEELANRLLWAPGQPADPLALEPSSVVGFVESDDADTGMVFDDDDAWDDDGSVWDPNRPEWFAVYLPVLEAFRARNGGAWDDDTAWDDECAWDEVDGEWVGLYSAIDEALRDSKAAGVTAYVYIGSQPGA